MEKKGSNVGTVIITVSFIVSAVLIVVTLFKMNLIKLDANIFKKNNQNETTTNTEEGSNYYEEIDVSNNDPSIISKYYNNYLTNLTKNTKYELSKNDDSLYTYYKYNDSLSEVKFTIDKDLKLYMTYAPLNYDNHLLDTNVLKAYVDFLPSGETLYYLKTDGSVYEYSFNKDYDLFDKNPRKLETWKNTINVLFYNGEIESSAIETICGLDDCLSSNITSNEAKEELYSVYLSNRQTALKEYMESTYIAFGDGQELGDFLSQGVDDNYYKIDRLLDLYIGTSKVDSEVIKAFIYKMTDGLTLYYIKADGSVYKYNFDMNYENHDRTPQLLSNLHEIINVNLFGLENNYVLFEDIEGNLFYSDGKPVME